MSGWSVVAMPPGYRERTTVFHREPGLTLRLLGPGDFVIAKLRWGTDQDLDDAAFVANKFVVTVSEIQDAENMLSQLRHKIRSYFFLKKLWRCSAND